MRSLGALRGAVSFQLYGTFAACDSLQRPGTGHMVWFVQAMWRSVTSQARFTTLLLYRCLARSAVMVRRLSGWLERRRCGLAGR